MVWTYTGDPTDSAKDALRFHLGDTDQEDQLLSDQEINYLLQLHGGNIYLATADAARTLAGKFSRQSDKQVGDLRLSLSQKSDHFWELAKKLELQGQKRVTPYAGGISKADKNKQRDREDRVKPEFKRDMMENPSVARADDVELRRRGV
jgi:hypothetical protein